MTRRLAVLGLIAATLAGCSSGSDDADGEATLRVYLSMPLTGPAAAGGRDAADGAELALADAGAEAGSVAVEAMLLDDTEGAGGEARWTPARAAANARAATQDSTAIAFLGDFESGATRASLPITNEARMLQVSPASGAADLVAPFPGSDEVPEVQPSGERTFGRVIPSDDAQAAAGADWVDRMGVRRVATLSDDSRFGKQMVSAFEDALRRASVTNRRVRTLYYGGEPDAQPASLSQSIPQLIVSDAELVPGAVAAQPPGTLATSAALDPSQLPLAGSDFVANFEAEYGRSPGRYAAYGYEAMAVILDSIDRATDPLDRAAVIDAFFATAERDSALGSYSIDEVGDTTLGRMTGYELVGLEPPEPVAELTVP